MMTYYKNYTLNNSFKLNCKVTNYYHINNLAELSDLLATHSIHKKLPLRVIGAASNVILPAQWQCLCVHIGCKGIETKQAEDNSYILRVAAGENWHQLVSHCVNNGLYGLENLALIPGNVGAAPIQNIGAYGVELKDFLLAVEAIEIETGTVYKIDAAECGLGYRQSKFKQEWLDKFIITHINLKLSGDPIIKADYDRLKSWGKPINTPKDLFAAVVSIRSSLLPNPEVDGNIGSFFHNPVICEEHLQGIQRNYPPVKAYALSDNNFRLAAASLLESIGLRGYSKGGVAMSQQHPLCMINLGNAKQEEVVALAEEIQAKVKQLTDVSLSIEPRIY